MFILEMKGGGVLFPLTFVNPDKLDKVTLGTANFVANNKDPKASLITSYTYLNGLVSHF